MVYFISNSIFKDKFVRDILKVVDDENNEAKVLEDG